jgi:hypothetical protein
MEAGGYENADWWETEDARAWRLGTLSMEQEKSGYRDLRLLEIFKVLNMLGLFYDILGLGLPSEVLSTRNKFQEFVANKLSGLIMWAHMGVPIGILAAGFSVGLIGGFLDYRLINSVHSRSSRFRLVRYRLRNTTRKSSTLQAFGPPPDAAKLRRLLKRYARRNRLKAVLNGTKLSPSDTSAMR